MMEEEMAELKEGLSKQQAFTRGYIKTGGETVHRNEDEAEDLRFVSTPSDMDDTIQNEEEEDGLDDDSLNFDPVKSKSSYGDIDYANDDSDSLRNDDEIEHLNRLVSVFFVFV
jgi:hypothetical protein